MLMDLGLVALEVFGGAVVDPFATEARHRIAQRRGKSLDLKTAVGQEMRNGMHRIETLRLLKRLPDGMSDNAVRKIIESVEYRTLARLLLASHVVQDEDMKSEVRTAVVTLIRQRFPFENSGKFTPGADNRIIARDRYADLLFQSMDEMARLCSESLERITAQKGEVAAWAYQSIALHVSHSTARYSAGLLKTGGVRTAEWLPKYERVFRDYHASITIPDFETRRTIPYAKLYVSPLFEQSITRQITSTEMRHEWQPIQARDRRLRSVILGTPGAGKSTMSAVLAIEEFSADSIPFYVRLRELKDLASGVDLVSAISSVLARRYQCHLDTRDIELLLIEGRSNVFFDGMDELLDTVERRVVSECIESFAVAFPLARLTVTSRFVGYSQARLRPELFAEFRIGPFDDHLVEQYIRKWFDAAADVTGTSLDDLVQHFMSQSSSIKDIRGNPLLLAFICILFRGYNYIPRNRPELFRRCSELLLRDWDARQRVGDDLTDVELARQSLEPLAYICVTDPSLGEGLTEAKAKAVIEDFLTSRRHLTSVEATRVAEKLIELCRGRAWIFTDVGLTSDGLAIFDFTHSSFREYFAALFLNRRVDSPEALAAELAAIIESGRLEILANVVLAIRENNTLDHAERVFAELLTRYHARLTTGQERKSRELLMFLINSSDTIALPSNLVEALVGRALDRLVRLNDTVILPLLDPKNRHFEAIVANIATRISAATGESPAFQRLRICWPYLIDIGVAPETIDRVRRAYREQTAAARPDAQNWRPARFAGTEHLTIGEALDQLSHLDTTPALSQGGVRWTPGFGPSEASDFDDSSAAPIGKVREHAPSTNNIKLRPNLALLLFSELPGVGGVGPRSIAAWIVSSFVRTPRQIFIEPSAVVLLRDIGSALPTELPKLEMARPVGCPMTVTNDDWNSFLRLSWGYDDDVRLGALFLTTLGLELRSILDFGTNQSEAAQARVNVLNRYPNTGNWSQGLTIVKRLRELDVWNTVEETGTS